ncbi:MAG: dITP/XTP pyrophosphatase [Candidatus Omnitrophica bacterium ADurb.Bin277]|nr:MAG: dITP/XTP pyrophosphatase [Candidatus Omnitrophica bacterium ADurb.Bin277]
MPDSHPRLKLLVATGNLKKLKELQTLLADLPVDLLSLRDVPDVREVEETGLTFEENARLKALGYAAQTGYLTLGEDSGISCDALGGAPGVFSARFAGNGKDDNENNRKMLEMMAGVEDDKRSAHYTAAVVLAEPGREVAAVSGEVHGFITRELRGSGGFGYDPLFYYPPFDKTFGEVSSEMKHSVSHRSRALVRLREALQEYISSRG